MERKCRIWYRNVALLILWLILHLAVSIWYILLEIMVSFETFFIVNDTLKKYEALHISKIRYLAVVIDSEEARELSRVFELLQWLVNIGVRSVCLYDPEGVLKKNKEAITDRFTNDMFTNAKFVEGVTASGPVCTDRNLTFEFLSFTDGKKAAVKAANYLFAKHYANGYKESKGFTESQMGEALEAIGSSRAEPDLLLIYGPIRCHLGFPAWRLRYTEIVHMGRLNSMKYVSLLKVIFRYTMVHQNYGC